jgi:hypothetical protein
VLDPASGTWSAFELTASQAFFTLLWEQLCDGKAHDAWQLRAMSLSALLQEMREICIAARTFEPLQHALGDVLDEATSVCRQDPVLREHLRSVVKVLEDNRLRESTPAALALAEQTSLYLLDTLKIYPNLLKQEIERALSAPSLQAKKRMKLLANALGTELRVRGFSRIYLLSFAHSLAAGPFSVELQRLLSLLDHPDETFRCFLHIKWPASSEVARSSRRAVHSELTEVEDPTVRQFMEKHRGQLLVKEVQAKDRFSAAQQALLIAGRALSLEALYAPSRVTTVPRHPVLIKAGSEIKLVEHDLAHEVYIKDSNRLAERLQEASPRITELLAAALQYHALGVQATAPESRLTNFWVARGARRVYYWSSYYEYCTLNRPFLLPSFLACCRYFVGYLHSSARAQ